MQETNTYLVSNEDLDSPMFIVAHTEQKAIQSYLRHIGIADYFLEELYTKTYNMSFYEQFWLPIAPGNGQDPLPTEQEVENYIPQFIQSVEQFCGERKDYAAILIYYFLYDKKEYPDQDLFPEEMIEFLWRKEIQQDNYFRLQVIDVTDIPHIGFE
jgi:hypothetical protein